MAAFVHPIATFAAQQPKVFDAFIFSGELDILEIRLNELDSVVDHFVIVESCEPHGAAGRRQPTYLANPERWAEVTGKFGNKIHYEVLDKLEPTYTDSRSGWARENCHRQALWQPIQQLSASPNDIVIVSDADEIPRASRLKQFFPGVKDKIVYLGLGLYVYNVNTYSQERWIRSYMATVKKLTELGGTQPPRGNLDMLPNTSGTLFADVGGWHFSSFMDLDRLREKLRSFAHSDDARVRSLLAMADGELARIMLQPKSLFTGERFEGKSSRDPELQWYLRDNPEKFAHFHAEYLEKKYGPASSDYCVDIIKAGRIHGFMSSIDLSWLAQQGSTRSNIVEIGSWHGRSTRAIADNTRGNVTAVDWWEGSPELKALKADHHAQFLSNMAGLDNVYDCQAKSVEAAALMAEAGEKFDMIFIDADHSYEEAKADILAWKPLLAEGGLLCGHDWHHGPVKQAVREVLGEPKTSGDDIWYF